MRSDPEALTRELIALDEQRPDLDLVQFRRLASARQYRRLYELAQRFVPAGAAVLDWGCGNGHMSYALDRLGYQVTAFSIEGAPPIAALLPRVTFTAPHANNPTALPFADATFDAVLSVGVLEHVRDTGGDEAESLREIRRVLKPGGVFLCYHLPNRYSYIEAVAALLPRAHHHNWRFTAPAIRALVTASGFELVEVRRYGALPRNPWQVMPRALGNSRVVAGAWDALDRALEWPLAPIVQNYYFVARR